MGYNKSLKPKKNRTGDKMKKYAIFFDIDGTIVPEDKGAIPESCKEAIRKVRENGHYTFINTGRTYPSLDPFIKELNFDGYVCGCGTNIYFQEKELFQKELGKEKSKEIVKDLYRYHIDGILEGKHNVYYRDECLHPQVHRIKHSRDSFGNCEEIMMSWNDENIAFDKMALWTVEGTDFASFRKKYENEFEFISRADDFYELVPLGFSKASGMEFLSNYLDIPVERMIAIGDSMNDISMLDYAGISIAMGNSHPYLLDKVSYVTTDIYEDGIYKALEHYQLI